MRPTYLAIALLVIYLVFLLVPSISLYFDITPLSLKEFLWILGAVASWTIIVRWVWFRKVVDRFLDADLKS